VNYVAPGAVDNREFTKVLAGELHKPAVLPIPGLAAKAKFGEVADELLLNGQHVAPAKLQAAGFKWQYPDFASAIHAALLEAP
jgi:NAD dependent epimerase/dehydratase family enzyme